MRILLVEDDTLLGDGIHAGLKLAEHAVDWVHDGEAARLALLDHAYDACVLDLGLPKRDGLSVLKELRDRGSRLPVMILTARDASADKIAGLDAGADDYLTKPFDARELLARVRAVLRRVDERRPVLQERPRPLIDFADWHLDVTRRELRSPDNVMIPLSAGEFDLLLVFVEHPQRILTREQLLDLARGHSHEAFDRSIDVQVSRLRRKLESDTKRPAMIRTVRNGGYLFTPSVTRR